MPDFKPTVSVIIPTYQRSHLVSQAINSVLAQTYKDYEIIVINDGSQDNTPQVLEQFKSYHHITVIHQKNQGLSAARNAGINVSKGKYIAFLDDDDLWETQKLEKQIPILEANPHLGLIYSDCFIFSEEKGLFSASYKTMLPTPNVQVLWTLFRRNYIPVLTVLVRRNCLEKVGLFDVNLTSCEDYDLWLRLIEKFPIYFLNEPLARYRDAPNSMSKNEEKLLINYLYIKEKAINRNPELLKFPLNFLDPYFYDLYLKLARFYIRNYQLEKASKVLQNYREKRGETPAYQKLCLSLSTSTEQV